MSLPTESYLKVQYELRPAKQVERRMIIDTLRSLSTGGFQISEYQYTGFGSIYFVDFVLFHKLLGIRKMVSVEHSPSIKKRVNFNKPFDCVQIKLKPIGDVIPTLSLDLDHFLWLDYDTILSEEMLQDVWLAAARLPKRSLLLVTIDVEPPDDSDSPREWKRFFEREAGNYLGTSRPLSDYSRSKLPTINKDIVLSTINSGLTGRSWVCDSPSPLDSLVPDQGSWDHGTWPSRGHL